MGKEQAKSKVTQKPLVQKARNYPGVCSKKEMGVFLFPLGWDASRYQGYPHVAFQQFPFNVHLGGERCCGVKLLEVSKPNLEL